MGKISELLGRTNSASATERSLEFNLDQPLPDKDVDSNVLGANGSDADPVEARVNDAGGFDAYEDCDLGARLGEDNEALRNLLVETGRKISELEEFKTAFINVVEPANKALRALEHEKTQNIGLRRALTQARAGHEGLQARFSDVEKKAVAFESMNAQLRHELEKAQESVRELRSSKAELANEFAVGRAAIADLGRQLAQQTGNVGVLNEDNKRLREQSVEAESRIGHLEGEIAAAREQLTFLEGDNRTSQKSLDQAVVEVSRLSQRLGDSETALTVARARLLQLEGSLAEVEAARNKLMVDLKDAGERYHAENSKLDRQVEALQARTAAADKLLVNSRQLLVTRSEEARSSDRKAREATFARDTAEKKLGEIKATLKLRESQIEELEKTRATLSERATIHAHSLKSCKAQLVEAEDRTRALTERISVIESDFSAARATLERRIDDLNATLEEERLEREVVEGALAATRRERAQLQDEISRLRVALRRGKPPEPTAQPAPAQDRDVSDRGAHAA